MISFLCIPQHSILAAPALAQLQSLQSCLPASRLTRLQACRPAVLPGVMTSSNDGPTDDVQITACQRQAGSWTINLQAGVGA